MDRISTGVPGLDEIMDGGLIANETGVVAGPAGSGKTVFGCQFIYHGLQKGEPGLYVSFEEDPEQIKRNMLVFGWDFRTFEQRNMVMFVKYDPFHLQDVYGLIENQVRAIDAKRVVIDSITGLTINMTTNSEIRISIYKLANMLKKMGCSAVMMAESPPSNRAEFTKFGVEEFVADDVIILYYIPVGSDFKRALTVWKMRGSKHSQKIHPYEIGDAGIEVYPKEEISLGEML